MRPPFNECSRCPAPLRDHTFADLAEAVAGSAAETTLTGLIEDGAWEKLPAVSARLPGRDEGIVTFRALRCPSGGGSVLPLALARTVLGDDRLAGTVYEVSQREPAMISAHCTPSWQPYSESWVGRSSEE